MTRADAEVVIESPEPLLDDELLRTRAACRSLVLRRASLSAGAAVLPLPILDVGTDIAILLRLIPAINREFGLTPEQIERLDPETKRVVLVLISSLGSGLIGRVMKKELILKFVQKAGLRVTAGTVSKVVPIVGSALAATLSFTAMKMLGDAHVEECYRLAVEARGKGIVLKAPTPGKRLKWPLRLALKSPQKSSPE
jgi:uncharacterized protein (DUF697 family)